MTQEQCDDLENATEIVPKTELVITNTTSAAAALSTVSCEPSEQVSQVKEVSS